MIISYGSTTAVPVCTGSTLCCTSFFIIIINCCCAGRNSVPRTYSSTAVRTHVPQLEHTRVDTLTTTSTLHVKLCTSAIRVHTAVVLGPPRRLLYIPRTSELSLQAYHTARGRRAKNSRDCDRCSHLDHRHRRHPAWPCPLSTHQQRGPCEGGPNHVVHPGWYGSIQQVGAGVQASIIGSGARMGRRGTNKQESPFII